MSKILIKNIRQLVQVEEDSSNLIKKSGAEMQELPILENAWLAIEDGIIADFGLMSDFPGIVDWRDLEVIDAENKLVLPSYVDSHTHLVFAAPRENEFVLRIKGASYEEIAASGGGILNSAKKLQQTKEDDLFESAHMRLQEIISMGTGAVEIKSGYGLSMESELKMLRVIQRLKKVSPIPIKASLLAAHAIPAEYKENRKAYIDLINKEIIPAAAEEKLVDYIDVFCDKGFFTPSETDSILATAAKFGLKPKIHANELDFSGGIQVGVKHKAISVDHLECTGEAEIEALLNSNTMPTLLPSTAFFLNLHYPPARKIIESGLPVSLASDYNPGSSPSGNMNFVLALACIQMKMTPEEALNAASINAAFALELQDEMGSIKRGKKANIFITKKINSYASIPYNFGANPVETCILNGSIYHPKTK